MNETVVFPPEQGLYRPENELTRKTAGTGIGLALVEMLAKKLGGSVSVDNLQPGARFTITLPAAAGAAPAAAV